VEITGEKKEAIYESLVGFLEGLVKEIGSRAGDLSIAKTTLAYICSSN
jgi:hypothetical protein